VHPSTEPEPNLDIKWPPAQSFAWLARSKHIFRRMNQSRFFFTMLRLMDLRNRYLLTKVKA
jgi:hypothetical protein